MREYYISPLLAPQQSMHVRRKEARAGEVDALYEAKAVMLGADNTLLQTPKSIATSGRLGCGAGRNTC